MANITERRQYKNKRFAVPDDVPFLTPQDEEPMVYPDVRLKVKARDGREGEWRMVKNIERYAERISQLYREGVYEMINQPDYEWHIHPSEIIAKDQNGSAKMYAVFLGGDEPHNIVQALSTTLIQPHRICWGIWTTVDPDERGLGIMKYSGQFLSLIGEYSGCDLVKVSVVTYHTLSQRTLEEAGFLPIGYFPGGHLYGGADGKCYRHNIIWYQKMFPRGLERTMTRDYERLLEGGLGARVARFIQQIWDEALQKEQADK
jgi:RimJ/RimL family protein N-acetyltransferase